MIVNPLDKNISLLLPRARMREQGVSWCLLSGVHNAKAEECTTPRIGSRNIEIKIGVGGLPRNQK